MRDDNDYEQTGTVELPQPTSSSAQQQYWHEKEKAAVAIKIQAHQCIITNKSPYFAQLLREKKSPLI